MRSMRQWFSLAVMAVSGLCSFASAKGQPLTLFALMKVQNADPTLLISDVNINEGNAGATEVLFVVTVADPNGQTVTVDFQIVDGTATQGSDYSVISSSGTMSFFAGATTQKVKVTINGDVVDEQNDETFFINLLNATNATIADAQGVGTIINDDGLPAPTAPGNLTANATGASTIALAWNDNSSDEDGFKIERKIPQGGTGNFNEITTVGKEINAFTDTGLSSGTSYVYRIRAYKGTANSSYSNEAMASTSSSGLSPTLSISDVSINEGNAGSTEVFFVVTVANPNAQTVSVDFQIVEGTATQGSDYSVISSSGTMTFFAGVTTQKIKVTINGDVVDEQRDETFLVNLLKVTNATITDNQGVGTIINDDGPPPPTAPSNLTANTTGASTIALAWSDNSSDEDGFKVDRKTGSGNFSEIITVGKDVKSYADAGLSAGTTYVYRVRAYKGTRNSGYSNDASATIQTLPPAAPSNLTTSATSASTVSIAWNDNSSDEDGFKIERKTGSGSFSEINTVANDIHAYDDTGLSAGTTYVYRVRAYRGTLSSSYSNVASAKTPVLPPTAPGNLTATATGTSAISLAWSDNSSDELGFRIERKTGSDSFSVIITVGKNVHSYKNTGLSAGTTYLYRVRAYRGAANSSYSNEAAAATKLLPPAAPSGLTASVTGTSTISLAWSDNSSDEEGFKIERKTGSGSFSEISAVGKDAESYLDIGLSAGTSYVYRVHAFKGAVNSTYSNEVSVTIQVLPPVAPGNLTANATGTSTISLAWSDNSSDEDGFKIERKIPQGGTDNFSEIATVGKDVKSYIDAGLSAITSYVYRVRAFKSFDNSSYSNEVAATIASAGNINLARHKPVAASSTDPSRPVTAAVDGDLITYWRSGTVSGSASAWLRVDLGAVMVIGKVIVAWKDNYIAKNYEVQVSNDAANWNAVHSAAGSIGSQTLNFPQTAARYVRLFFTQNIKSNYRIIEFEIYSGLPSTAKRHGDAVVGTAISGGRVPEEFVLEQNYPNPFSARGIFDNPGTRISFSLPQAERVTLKIYTISGVEVNTLVAAQYPAGKHTVVFKPKNLPSGTYFYVMQAGAVRRVRQLILVK